MELLATGHCDLCFHRRFLLSGDLLQTNRSLFYALKSVIIFRLLYVIQLTAKIQQAEVHQKATARKAEDRVKVLVGAAVLHQQTQSTEKRAALFSLLDGFLTRPAERLAVLGEDGKGSDSFKRLVTGHKPTAFSIVSVNVGNRLTESAHDRPGIPGLLALCLQIWLPLLTRKSPHPMTAWLHGCS